MTFEIGFYMFMILNSICQDYRNATFVFKK